MTVPRRTETQARGVVPPDEDVKAVVSAHSVVRSLVHLFT